MRVLFASAALAVAGIASPAAAQSIDQTYTVSIAYGDLNLSSAAGRATFERRIKAGAAQACFGPAITPLENTIQFRECSSRFIKAAHGQLELASAPSGGAILAAR